MARLVSAWTDGDHVRLVQREGEQTRLRSVPADWSLFVTGLDADDRETIGRDRRVIGIHTEGDYTRIRCRNRWARRDIVEILEGAIRQNGSGARLLEADVSPLRRLLSDVPSLEVHPSPRLCYFDLETDSRASFDEMKEGQARVLSWALVYPGGEREDAAVLFDDNDGAERALLRSFFERIREWDVDVLLAWNGDGFDFPVLQKRAEALKVRTSEGWDIPWHRWCWLDQLQVFKKYNMHSDGGGEQKTSFRLDHVAHYLLGEGKHDFDASKTWEAWEAGGEERERLLRYNLQDTRLLPRIEEATGFLGLHLAVCHICRVFPDTESLNATAQGDGYLIRLGTEYGYRMPSRPKWEDTEPQKFRGAFVMEPTKVGAIDNVHVCDFSGLYPSIMRTWNMSPDTKVTGQEADDLARQAHGGGMFDALKPVTPEGICQLPGRSTWFRTDRDGILRLALDRLVAKRGEYQAEMKNHTPGSEDHDHYKRLSQAFKIVANSFYGITGSPWSRFYDPDIAEGVTQTGAWLLKDQVIEEAKKRGLDPFYGDTDSAFVAGGAEAMKDLVRDMNASWGERLRPWGIREGMPSHVDLDFEKTFSRIVIVSAKRYAGKYLMYKGKEAAPDAAPEVKGLEFKRGDTIKVAREMQSEIVHMLLDGAELPDPAEIRQVIERWRDHVLNGELTLEDVALSQALSKPAKDYATRFTKDLCLNTECGHRFGGTAPDGPAKCPECDTERPMTDPPIHVQVAKMLEKRGEAMGEGSRVSYIITGSTPKLQAIPSSEPGALQRADRLYYWERRVYPATERILEKVYPGQSWGESKAQRKQRVREVNGQSKLDFDNGHGRPRTRRRKKKPGGKPRVRRRRKKKAPVVWVTLAENGPDPEGGAESHRRRLVMEALRAAIEAHPGDRPVHLRITFRGLGDPPERRRVKAEMPTGLSVDPGPAARAAIQRVLGHSDRVEGFAG